MPISQKILSEIENLDVEPDFKKLMHAILKEEDNGVHRWKKEYENCINKFISSQGKEDT